MKAVDASRSGATDDARGPGIRRQLLLLLAARANTQNPRKASCAKASGRIPLISGCDPRPLILTLFEISVRKQMSAQSRVCAPLKTSENDAARSRRKPTKRGDAAAISAPTEVWLGCPADEIALARMGIRLRGGGAALYRLRQLYGVGESWPLWVMLRHLWDRDPVGQPILALLCALARDPTLRDGSAAVLDASLGEPVRWPAIAAAFEARLPGRLGAKMAKSLVQNAASTWTQAGFLRGAVQKHRVRAVATARTRLIRR
jgi:hypothetical protein